MQRFRQTPKLHHYQTAGFMLLIATAFALGCSKQPPAPLTPLKPTAAGPTNTTHNENAATQPAAPDHAAPRLWHPDTPTLALTSAGTLQAASTTKPIAIDGRLDDPVWSVAPIYRLQSPGASANTAAAHEPEQAGRVMIAWDDQFLYAALAVRDHDILQTDDHDHQHHYRTGDVLELFIKPILPQQRTAYLELYATPHGRKTVFQYIPGRRLGMPDILRDSQLQVAAQLQGTLNDASNIDVGWTAEMAIPLSELHALRPQDTRTTTANDTGTTQWALLVGRYNADRHRQAQLSTLPHLPRPFFHLPQHWATLTLPQPAPATPTADQ